jgi:hypothetical protein
MPSLALIFHLFGQGERETGAAPDDSVYGGVSADNAGLAIKWCNSLETHARRIARLGINERNFPKCSTINGLSSYFIFTVCNLVSQLSKTD